MSEQENAKKYYVGQQEVTKADYPKEGWVQYTIQYPNMKGELEDITETVTVEQFDAIKSETPYENGLVAVKMWNGLISELLAVLLKHDIRMGDKEFIIQRLDQSIVENYRKATAKLFKRKHGDFVRFSQVDEILKSDTEMLED